MRGRLTLSFVVVTLALVLAALVLHSYTVEDRLREHESAELRREVATMAVAVEQRRELGRTVDSEFLSGLVGEAYRVEYASADGSTVTAEGVEYVGNDPDQDLQATADAEGAGQLTLRQSDAVLAQLSERDRSSLTLLVLILAVLAGLIGYFVARLLTAPFSRLADAANQLSRGRFDLDLPSTRMPEARAIGNALKASAGQLQERLSSETAFAEHASHVLRTPLTGLRLEMEDLATRDDLPEEVRDTAHRSVGRIESMDAVAGELVQLARRGSLVAGAEIPLAALATQCAQKWADALAADGRPVAAAVEGWLETTYTPGPVEHLLDLLLPDFLERGAGPTRMVFEADEDGLLRISLSCAEVSPHPPGREPDVPITQARAVVAALGGRLAGDSPSGGLEILLPRR